jgi:hypothetical protein
MRRLVRWIAGLISIAALAKLLGRHRRSTAAPVETASEPDPAKELRRKLAEVRSSAPAAADDEPAAAGTTADAPGVVTTADVTPESVDEPGPSIEERRAAIHARAQEAIDAMRETDG